MVADYFKSKPADAELVAKIDFPLTDSLLLESIESQTKVDLCKNSRFRAIMNYQNIDIEFPAFAHKKCNWYRMRNNFIIIMINVDNQVLIDSDLIKSDESLEKNLIKATKEMIIGNEKKNILYLLQWDPKIKSDMAKQRVFETLKGILNYSNIISLKKFKKNISELTETEKKKLKEEFSGIIGLYSYYPPTPPKIENE